jgi:ATP-binding cassette subfamily B protein
LVFLFSLLSGATPAAQVWMSKVVIDRVVENLKAANGGTGFDWASVLMPIALVFLIWVLSGVCRSVSGGLVEQIGHDVHDHSQRVILTKAASLDVAFYETPAFYDLMENARSQGHRVHNLAVLSVLTMSGVVAVTTMLALLCKIHPAVPLVLLVTSAPQVIIGGHYAGRQYTLYGEATRSRRMAEYLSRLLGSRDAVKEIRVYGLHDELLRRCMGHWRGFTRDMGRLRFAREKAQFLFGFLSMAGTAAIWTYAVVRAVKGQITVGDVALAFQASEGCQRALDRLFGDLGLFYEHTIFAGNLFKFLDMDPKEVEGALAPPPESPSRIPRRLSAGIEFHGVSFQYPHGDRFVLRNLSFKLKAGQTVAIVGENGAGKTTLVKLLARFYDPTEGAISLDGRDLREYDLDDLRRQIGIIFQDFVRYDLSARENVGFGRVEYHGHLERVKAAAEKGGALEMIEGLPNGFDTVLGRTFDEGVDLSGGEWQKIALSRAFMREAQILILDEPTAALDALAEYELYHRFAALTTDRTTVFISHRFSTVRMARHIIVLKQGELVEQGTHDELMGSNGLYSVMYNTQAERYR